YFNFIMQVSPECDCYQCNDAPIVPDIGILASLDPVAIDQCSADMVNEAVGITGSKLSSSYKKGTDKFKTIYPEIDWSVQLEYGEKLGIGSRKYELVKI
ncbi:4Fe-4S ferredoxin, partial [Candidatus Desantisbacteria bacterium]|nr:4Fe-4S ferredoxin [Candidatus Desantisbacteria bacterium]